MKWFRFQHGKQFNLWWIYEIVFFGRQLMDYLTDIKNALNDLMKLDKYKPIDIYLKTFISSNYLTAVSIFDVQCINQTKSEIKIGMV